MTEREQRYGSVRRGLSVTHGETFAVLHLVRFAGEPGVGSHVGLLLRERLSEPAAGVDVTVQNIDKGAPGGLATQIGLDDRSHPIQPGHHDRTAVGQGHDRAGVCCRHCRDEPFLLLRQMQVGPVETLALVDSRQPGHQHHDIRFGRHGHSVVDQGWLQSRQDRVVPGGVANVDTGIGERLTRRGDGDGVDQRAAGSLEPRVFGEGADERHCCSARQRQGAIIDQQDAALGRSPSCERVVLSEGRRALLLSPALVDHVQHAVGAAFEGRRGQMPRLHSVADLGVGDSVASGHLQIHARVDCGDSVVGGPPVAHHQTLELPLLAQYRRQQQSVVGAVGAVDEVVGSHDSPRTGVGDHVLEPGQVELAQSPVVHDSVDDEPMALLVVHREVLHAGTDPAVLDAANHGGRQPATDQWVLGQVLEVASTQWVTLDVEPRA